MLTVFGPRTRYCDGVSRRSFLKVGALGVGGLTLPQLMRAEAASGKKTHKSVIMVYLSGGMAHQDTFDLKPNGPAELRGELKFAGSMFPRLALLRPESSRPCWSWVWKGSSDRCMKQRQKSCCTACGY